MNKFLGVFLLTLDSAAGRVVAGQAVTASEGSVCPCSCSDPVGIPSSSGDLGVLVQVPEFDDSYCVYESIVKEVQDYDIRLVTCAPSCATEAVDVADALPTNPNTEDDFAQQLSVNTKALCPCSCSQPVGFAGSNAVGYMVAVALGASEEQEYCMHEAILEEALDYFPSIVSCGTSCSSNAVDAVELSEETSQVSDPEAADEIQASICPCSCSNPIGFASDGSIGNAGVLVTIVDFEGQPYCVAESVVEESLKFASETFSCITSCSTGAIDAVDIMDEFIRVAEESESAVEGYIENGKEDATQQELEVLQEQCPCSCSSPLSLDGVQNGVAGVLVEIAGLETAQCIDVAVVETTLGYVPNVLTCVTSC